MTHFSSPVLQRHLDVLALLSPPSYSPTTCNRHLLSKSSSRKLSLPSAFPDTKTHLATAGLMTQPPGALYPALQVSLPRVWLPSQSDLPLVLIPLRASFSPQRSWDSPFKAFLLQGDLERFPFLPPLLRFPVKPFRPYIVASAASPHLESRLPFSLPRCLVQVGSFCSLGISNLSGFSLRRSSPFIFSLNGLPFHSY